jgi:dienelactone hydrolase
MPSRTIFVKTIFCVAIVASSFIHEADAQEELKVISAEGNSWLEFTDAPNTLYHHLAAEGISELNARAARLGALKSVDQWKQEQKSINERLQKMVGPFPARTPLNAKIVRTVQKDGYRVEHIVYESQPSFYVTSSLFIPASLKKREKAPVVIYCSGHSENGYRSQVYQHVILNLVKKGFIVFAFDPVGQGERLEYYDASSKKSSVGGPTSEHSYPGSQAFVTGSCQARYMIWDGIRAVDYLLTRRDVDPARIGITGRSGGGTQSAYIAAFDDRIKAAAPECYITTFKRLLQSIGPQDAEQNFPGEISNGIDHADLLLVRAPKPALMITTTRDMFSIAGARETAREVSRIYSAYGQTENFTMVEDDAPHASTKKNREAMYAFFQEHLDNPGSAVDEEVPILTEAEMTVTTTGQVSTSLKGETVFSLNRRETERLIHALDSTRAQRTPHMAMVAGDAKKLSGYLEPSRYGEPVFAGRIQRDGYAIEKYFVKGEGDYVLPYLLFVPAIGAQKAILYLHPSGKQVEASADGEIAWFAKRGFVVLAPDLPGTGDLGAGAFAGDSFIGGISHNIWYTALLVGRSVVGVQAGDIARLVNVLKTDLHIDEIYGVARKEMSPALLHAAVFLPSIRRVALVAPLASYRSFVMNRFYYSPFIMGAVPAMLTAYDLPDLAAVLAPRNLLMIGATDGQGTTRDIDADLSFVRKSYDALNASATLFIAPAASDAEMHSLFEKWMK